jgi:RNA polymerase sigma-70 factor (ECF subfamily)
VPTEQPTQQEAFERIAMPHLAALLRVARRLTLNGAAAEDLVQETMLLAWRGFHRFQTDSNARAWLFRILLNAFYGQGRKAQRASALLPVSTVVDTRLQEALEIREALEALPIEQRTVLLLCVVEGFTCREAAEISNVPIGTVMSRLSRARQELRNSLAPPMTMPKTPKAMEAKVAFR